ncbi:MAG: hypothetical protein R3F50_17640 [Gammaproteobacteria bacterium]|jgi:hypothetical protein
MNNKAVISAILTLSIYLPGQLHSSNASAQVSGFFVCVDDAGNPGLCSGEIPADLLPDEPVSMKPDGRGCGKGLLTWSENNNSVTPGIKSAVLHTYCHDGREVVIWTDFEQRFLADFGTANISRRQVTDSDSNQVVLGRGIRRATGFLEGHTLVNYQFEISGDSAGAGFINDSLFDLKDGDLFLVATEGPAIEIRQIHYNLAYISAEDIKWLAIEHPEISSFFEDFHE